MATERYSVEQTRAVERDLKALKHLEGEAVQNLLVLEDDPRRGEVLTGGTLRGVRSLHFTMAGVHYRAAYALDARQRLCLVFLVATRENFYREAEHRYALLKKRGMV